MAIDDKKSVSPLVGLIVPNSTEYRPEERNSVGSFTIQRKPTSNLKEKDNFVQQPVEQGRPNPAKARAFAERAHAGQDYEDEVPYSFHLEMVVQVLARFGFTDPEWVCCGWLHDVIEDTNKSYNDIRRRFGVIVAERVYAVTAAKGRNRSERNPLTYLGIKGIEEFIILKLADRIANIEYGLASPDGKVDMYTREFASFEKGIREEDLSKEGPQVTRMWNHLKLLLGLPLAS